MNTLLTKREVKIDGYRPKLNHFCVFIDRNEKRGQYSAILTEQA